MFLGLQWYWRLVTVAVLIISIPFKVKFMKWWSKRQSCQILFPVFGGEMATAKIQTVKGLRVEIFSRTLRKNTTRPLTVWIVGTDVERGLFFIIRYGIIFPSTNR